MTTNTSAPNTTNNNSITERINDDYEWIQYNEHLRLIHSIKDDMYQMQSIVNACNANKRPNDWFRNQSTQEFLEAFEEEIASTGNPADEKSYENRPNLPINLRGTYVHKLLVNHIAIWASPRYSIYIMKLLDKYYENERQKLLKEKDEIIDNLKPRTVPQNTEHDYKYLIWKETRPESNTFVILHLVRRHKSNFRAVNEHFKNLEQRWFYRENLPISMSPNRDIKKIVKENFADKDARVHGFDIIINKNCLDDLHDLIEEYFDNFQE